MVIARHASARILAAAILTLLLLAAPALADTEDTHPVDPLEVAISAFVEDTATRQQTVEEAARRIAAGARDLSAIAEIDSVRIASVLEREVIRNLEAKRRLRAGQLGPFPLTAEELLRTVVEYEIWKLRTYLLSGVFAKRYFGYVDRKWDTAAEEETMLRLAADVVAAINAYQEERGRPTRLTDLEVIVTYLSEGAALYFREWYSLIERPEERSINLYAHHGCDNIGAAVERYGALVRSLDGRFGTRLGEAPSRGGVNEIGGTYRGLGRNVTFTESIVANAIMFLFEKENARRRLAKRVDQESAAGWPSPHLEAYDGAEQFVITSLVFNTGMAFPWRWVREVRDFAAIEHLHEVSEKNEATRALLPVDRSPAEAFARLEAKGYRRQPTSWQGAYHVLQRYGAYVALRDMTDYFDASGRWKR